MDYSISNDSILSRFIDGLVVLILGVAIGVVISQIMLTQEVTTVTTKSEITKRKDALSPSSDTEDHLNVDLPSGSRVEEN